MSKTYADNSEAIISKERITDFRKTAQDRLAESQMPITRGEVYEHLDEVVQNTIDVMDAFNLMKAAVNAQAEVLGLLRFTIQKYLPAPHLEEAAAEYKAIREKEIAAQKAAEEEVARNLQSQKNKDPLVN